MNITLVSPDGNLRISVAKKDLEKSQFIKDMLSHDEDESSQTIDFPKDWPIDKKTLTLLVDYLTHPMKELPQSDEDLARLVEASNYLNIPSILEPALRKVHERGFFQFFEKNPMRARRSDFITNSTLDEIKNILDTLNKGNLTAPAAQECRTVVKEILSKRALSEYDFIELPAVTDHDVQHLKQARVKTSINNPISAFKIANAVTSIGLYHAVMGHYPKDADEKTRNSWLADPDLPVTYTTAAEDKAFAAELSRLTGRKFFIPNESQLEYAIRGRDGSGEITTTKYHFGEDESEVRNRAWVYVNSGHRPHGVHEIPEGRDYKNSFGLIHAIGNVWQRSSDGVTRGGAFSLHSMRAASSDCERNQSYPFDVGSRIGFRLAEAL